MTAVYVLCDPEAPAHVRYVGVAAEPKKRYHVHLVVVSGERTRKASWLKSLLEQGRRPAMDVVSWHERREQALEMERVLIFELRRYGHELTNLTDGGEGVPGRRLSQESKDKIGRANSRKRSAAACANVAAARKALWANEERAASARKGLQAAALAHWSNPEAREKASTAQRKRFSDPAQRALAKAAASLREAERSAESKERIRQARRRQWASSSSPTRTALANPERSRKISEARKAWWAARRARC